MSRPTSDRLVAHREQRRHPVYAMLNSIAAGTAVREADLDALKLPPGTRRTLAFAADRIADERAAGSNQQAREEAKAAAGRIIETLPPEQQDPDYLRPADPQVGDDPAALAAQVRWLG